MRLLMCKAIHTHRTHSNYRYVERNYYYIIAHPHAVLNINIQPILLSSERREPVRHIGMRRIHSAAWQTYYDSLQH